MLPRVWLVPYRRDWSYDITARALVRHLSHRFDFRFAYTSEIEALEIERDPRDLVVDMWWRGTIHYYRAPPHRVIKQVSSHRWTHAKWGRLKPTRLLKLYCDTAAVVVPSRRLLVELTAHETDRSHDVWIGAKGFDPALFFDHGRRTGGGELTVGWAGAMEASDKHVDIILDAHPEARIADQCLTQREMGDFYNGCDVIAVASEAEGDPRPLIEGMACGCFPIATDVGIVPELVEHGVNGLIVQRSPASFARALAWCRANRERVLAAGRSNAELMRRTRTWAHVAPMWGDLFDAVIERARVVEIQGDSQVSA